MRRRGRSRRWWPTPRLLPFFAGTHAAGRRAGRDWIAVGDLSVDIAFRLDPLSALMLSFVTFVGFLIHVYSIGYMHHDETDAGYARFFAYLNLFLFSMLTLVLAENFLLMFVGWEGVGLCSYLLVGYYFDREYAAAAGPQGVRRQPDRRLRVPARDVRHLHGLRHAQLLRGLPEGRASSPRSSRRR